MNNNNYQWLSSLEVAFNPDANFLKKMGQTLEAMSDRALGSASLVGAFLMPPMPEAFQISSRGQNIYSLDGDLVIDGFGYRVQICWEYSDDSEKFDIKKISDTEKLRFWWCKFPVKEILQEQNKSFSIPINVASFSFVVESKTIVLPHILFQIHCASAITTELVENLNAIINEAQSSWNRENGELRGFIHSVGLVTQSDQNLLIFKIDLGNAGWEALEYLFEILEGSEFKVTRIELDNY
ncbi:hypothetical protein JMN32_16365 [Fulvivirga sp. 29W222]|uniref:Uncharacterized protein n=1 Tax=Fulvivirga marina TaxID=2494733 RepID=A0A937FXF6_9BACT|nr:hypothetical protein [Fulvivirga marina]MBL6447894.1 hypothetical protein [Fulvivirga marina]